MQNSTINLRLILAAIFILIAVNAETRKILAKRSTLPDDKLQPVKLVATYPEFQLKGRPFFTHSTAFFYNRIPRDEWGASLAKLKQMGINTVDLYIAWNWHEPEEGKLDFDGRSNPRRDVKGLLEMIDEMGFAIIVRPGPVILNEWRNGGYPDWLLSRPEYRMNETARLDGHYPPLCSLSPINSEEASKQWLANETHLRYTRRWFADVMRELLKDRQATNGGNVIAIQLDDDQAINRANYNGPIFWKYMNTLAGYLREAGATVPLYLNPTDMRVSAAGAPHNIGVMGQWYFNFGSDPALRWEDTATLQFYTETLKTQPHFPPMIIEYQAGWYGRGDDTYAKTADPTNTLLSSRVMIGHGLRGLNYFPVQDTLYPAGYEVPWANHYYTWESALNLERRERSRASAVHRNGRLIAGLGKELAGAHKAADIGLVYPISSDDQVALTPEQIMRISRAQMQVQQYCQLNQISVEYIDLEFQPLEHLKRHQALLIPEARLSQIAQRKLVDYVNSGGILICTPAWPQGEIIKELANKPRVITLPDFWRGIPIEPGKVKREELISSVQSSAVEFVSRLTRLGVNRNVKARVRYENDNRVTGEAVGATIEPNFIGTQLVSGMGQNRYGFVSVVNFDDRKSMRVSLLVKDPLATEPADGSMAARVSGGRIELPEFTLRARDSLLLPMRLRFADFEDALREPSASGVSATVDLEREEIYYATAELVKREMANGKLLMRFYAPDPAEVVLSLPHAPQGPVTIDGTPVNANYDPQKRLLSIKIIPPKTSKENGPSGRREHEHDVEVVYEKGVPELNVKTARLIIGETNQVAVEVANRNSQPLRGNLVLIASQGFKSEQFKRPIELKPREAKIFSYELPLSAKAVEGDQVNLRAVITGGVMGISPSITADIRPRFEWRIYPKVTWPLRADAEQVINPPLIYPSDDNATEGTFNLRMSNNSAGPINLTRSSLLVNSLPLRLGPDEEYQNTYTYNFAPGTKSVLNPFEVKIGDGRSTATARVVFVALRKGEAVAFAYDIDRDGFDDYVLENEHLRLIVSPRAGARSFALINKKSGINVFTSVGGLRDKFVELDPADPTTNPRRRRGMYGTFNRPYSVSVTESMGKQAVLKMSYEALDAYPAGARIERNIILKAGDDFFTVDYLITPHSKTVNGKQSFWSSNSIIVGDPNNQARRFVSAEGIFDFMAAQTKALNGSDGWVAASIAENITFAILWRGDEVNTADLEMKDFSSFVNLKFKPFTSAAAQTYRLIYYFGSKTPERLAAERSQMLR
jgi:hypothetical protein